VAIRSLPANTSKLRLFTATCKINLICKSFNQAFVSDEFCYIEAVQSRLAILFVLQDAAALLQVQNVKIASCKLPKGRARRYTQIYIENCSENLLQKMTAHA
jgi:hypothetical protein